jgi:hypothetical protein
MAKFSPGDKVVWSHKHGALHAEGSKLKRSAVESDGDDVRFGEIVGSANGEQTWFDVSLDGGETKTLTGDELVAVASEE